MGSSIRFCISTALVVLTCGIYAAASPDELEKKAALAVQKAGGDILRDMDGHVDCICLFENPLKSRITEKELESIDFAAFPRLSGLSIVVVKLSDRGLAAIAKSPMPLFTLSIAVSNESKVSDGALLAFLKKQTSVYQLSLGGLQLSDKAIAQIAQTNSIRLLGLSRASGIDKAMKIFAASKCVLHLDLGDTDLTDAGMREIAKMTRLRSLAISDCSVTDDGLMLLAQMQSLQMLDVSGARTTEQGIKALKKERPRLEIRWERTSQKPRKSNN